MVKVSCIVGLACMIHRRGDQGQQVTRKTLERALRLRLADKIISHAMGCGTRWNARRSLNHVRRSLRVPHSIEQP